MELKTNALLQQKQEYTKLAAMKVHCGQLHIFANCQ